MTKKILVLLGAVLVFGLAFGAYAINKSGVSAGGDKSAASCCKGDSCAMKSKNSTASKAADSSSCDCSCCKAGGSEHTCCGDSCPMKGAQADHAGMKMEKGESCPMMKGEAAGHKTHAGGEHKMAADGKGCCCACCNKDKSSKEMSPAA